MIVSELKSLKKSKIKNMFTVILALPKEQQFEALH